MKTPTLLLSAVVSAILFASSQPVKALELPNDLTPIASADAPIYGTFWSLAYWPDYPPLPFNGFDMAADLYYSPGLGYPVRVIWVDDRAKVAARMLTESSDPPPIPGGDDSGGPDYFPPQPYYDWTTNFTDLWIWLDSYTNAGDGMTYFFTIHNTQSGLPYEIISSTNVAAPMNPTNWYSEGVWLASSTNLSAYVPMGSKTNRNFFRAHLWTDFTYGVPTNGQIFIQSLTNDIYPVINGVTNHLTPFWSNWYVLHPRPTNIYALNLGYDASDGGMTNNIINTNPPQQVIRFAGFSKTITNLCISSNHITSLNVAGWPALQSVDAWHCISNLNVNVKNCPQLRRTCFEALNGGDIHYGITNALDYTGCTNIAEIRAADNRFTDLVIDDASVSNVWHLCIHNNTVNQLPIHTSFSRYPALKELWIWDDYFQGPLVVTKTNSPNLTSVQAVGNYFAAGDFHDQTNLYELLLDSNTTLTNLNIAGCSNLVNVTCIDCGLTTSAVDDILVKLDSFGKTKCTTSQNYTASNLVCTLFNQSYNYNQPPSDVGLAAAASLKNKGWTVFPVPPTNTTPNTSPIWFTNTSSSVSMQVSVTAGATVTWAWGDTSMNSVVTNGVVGITKNLGASYSNAVMVTPASALLGFGVSCSGGTTLSGVGGLTNYPYLKELHLYQTGLNTLSLAGCSNLVSIALVSTSPSTNVCHAWFTDLATAQPNTVCGLTQFGCGNVLHHFYFPLNPGTNGIPEAVSNLVRVGWTLEGY
jgi:hypothetical protein